MMSLMTDLQGSDSPCLQMVFGASSHSGSAQQSVKTQLCCSTTCSVNH